MVQIPRLPFCCFLVPLRIGAFIIAVWMLVWNAYSGATVMFTSYGTSLSIVWKIMGVAYLVVAAGSLFGAHAIYHEIPHRVATFVKLFIANIVLYFVLSIAFVVAVSIVVANAHKEAVDACEQAYAASNSDVAHDCDAGYVGYPIISWLIPFLISFALWVYFAICINSYSLELQDRQNDQEKTAVERRSPMNA